MPKPIRLRDILAGLLGGGFTIGVEAALGKLGPPGGKKQVERYRAPDPRSFAAMSPAKQKLETLRMGWQREDDERAAEARKYTSPEALAWKEWFAEKERVWTQQRLESDRKAGQAFAERIATLRAEQATKAAEQTAAPAPEQAELAEPSEQFPSDAPETSEAL